MSSKPPEAQRRPRQWPVWVAMGAGIGVGSGALRNASYSLPVRILLGAGLAMGVALLTLVITALILRRLSRREDQRR